MEPNELKALIIESIKYNMRRYKEHFELRPTLINSVKYILEQFYVSKKRIVIGELPTGSGKTIIGFLTHFCCEYIERKLAGEDPTEHKTEPFSYFLTSNKILQDQIDRDIEKFNFGTEFTQLKGISNYACSLLTERFEKEPHYREAFLKSNPNASFVSYEFRPCKYESGEIITQRECFSNCPYKRIRGNASRSNCAVLNYAYFLNVMQSDNPTHFNTRRLTICDEAHLLPGIVTNMFTFSFSVYQLQQFIKYLDAIRYFGRVDFLENIKNECSALIDFYTKKLYTVQASKVEKQLGLWEEFVKSLDLLSQIMKDNKEFQTMHGTRLQTFLTNFKEQKSGIGFTLNLMTYALADLYIESDIESNGYYKHTIRDLSEHRMVKKHFLTKCDKILMMSATIGKIDAFVELLGLESYEYSSFKVGSTFNFDKSPIYLCNAGLLNYANIQNNLEPLLQKVLKICFSKRHQNHRGVIHTTTFDIQNKLIELLAEHPDKDRFMFYKDSYEKELIIKSMESNPNGILVGPSLYEGLDLKDDLCRFQIIIKVPYAQINEYVKQKQKRYPLWYLQDCKQKIVQAIGRSNRHKDDWSCIYLMDTMFDKIAFDLSDDISNRITYINL